MVYLTTLEIINKGEMITCLGDKWVLPFYPDATIIGETIFKKGWLCEETRYYKPEINEIKYYKLSKEGLFQLKRGRKWWNDLSLIEKIFIRFKFW